MKQYDTGSNASEELGSHGSGNSDEDSRFTAGSISPAAIENHSCSFGRCRRAERIRARRNIALRRVQSISVTDARLDIIHTG